MNSILSNAKAYTGSTALAAIAALGVMLAMAPFAAAQEQGMAAIPDDLPPEYHRCHKVLWSYPLTTLKDYVPLGYGARLSTG